MIQRDFILRQIQQLVQVLAQVLTHKAAREAEPAQDAIASGLREALGLDLDALRALSREELTARCAPDGELSDGRAVIVADLLREDADAEGRRRARWIYEAVLAHGADAVPFDIHARIASLPDDNALPSALW